MAGFVAENHYGWTFVPFLQAFGGNVFRNPPDDLMPVLDTPEGDCGGGILRPHREGFRTQRRPLLHPGPGGQGVEGRARQLLGERPDLSWSQLGDSGSKVAGTSAFGLAPRGPAGRFPGVAVHGLGIPAASKNKEAAWAFIQWAMSKQRTRRAMVEENARLAHPALGDRSAGIQEQLDHQRLRHRRASPRVDRPRRKGGYMKYRTVPVYPQVDQQIDKAIANIASGQLSASQAMEQAQAGSIAELKRAGVEL